MTVVGLFLYGDSAKKSETI